MNKWNKTYSQYFIQTNATFEDDWYANECYTKRSEKDLEWIPPYPQINFTDVIAYSMAVLYSIVTSKIKE